MEEVVTKPAFGPGIEMPAPGSPALEIWFNYSGLSCSRLPSEP